MTDSVIDRTLHCGDCGGAFVFSIAEQQFFADKGFSDPIRCKACRQLARVRREAARVASPAIE
jgi:hypothetical protein